MKTITLITGSTTRGAECVAEHVSKLLEKYKFNTQVTYGPSLKDLPIKGIWLIICSTHGADKLPENIQPLAKEINSEKPDLSQINYGAIGIGSREYDTFCSAIHILDQLLKNYHAKRIGEILEIDILEYESPKYRAENWIRKWKDNITDLNK